MTPEQIAALTAMATLLKTVGTLPFGVLITFVVVGPWAAMVFASNAIGKRMAEATAATSQQVAAISQQSSEAIRDQNESIKHTSMEFHEHVKALSRGQEKRFEETAHSQEKRFEAVVRMYENNIEVVRNYHNLANDLTAIITLSTRTLEGLVAKIDNNQFCPIVRKETGK
ncbi:MAG: hypothetical protein HY911_04440 [Desulfobacterales bacterium]|nr:hypothetical protein [Desulfobacterales bacterium]